MLARTRLTIALLSASALTACGSTALSGNAAGGNNATVGIDQGVTASDGSGGATSGATSTGSSSTSTTGFGTSSPGGAGTTGIAGTSGTTGGMGGSGTTGPAEKKAGPATPIRLGVVGVDATAMAAAFGDTKNYSGQVFSASKAMIAYVNKHGGVAGHQLKPVYVSEDISKDSQQAGQDACSQLTEDNKVDVVLSQQFVSETLYACLKQRGISIFNAAIFAPDAQYTSQYSNNYLPGGLRADRYGPAAIMTALKSGVLKKGDKLGVLIEDCPWGLAHLQQRPRAASQALRRVHGDRQHQVRQQPRR